MLFSLKPMILLTMALTAVASPIANPMADESHTLVSRATIKDIDCDGTKFTTTDIKNAISQSRTGAGKYPDTYSNSEGYFKTTTQLYEYSLVSGSTYTNSNPGKYRVIMNEKYNYIGSLYYIRGVSNGFKKCTNVEASPATTTTTTTTTKATTKTTTKTTTKATTKTTTKTSTKTSNGKTSHKSGSKSSKKGSRH
ncbi:hypothetical protein CBS147343_8479 [Aspergillus niger]|nr:hypothetical protein CBS147343_8479 [Aspergillus niger]